MTTTVLLLWLFFKRNSLFFERTACLRFLVISYFLALVLNSLLVLSFIGAGCEYRQKFFSGRTIQCFLSELQHQQRPSY
jgi:hypothetical protein